MLDTRNVAPARPCPTCGREAAEKFRPFCSQRCADVDLNRWLSGVYAVPVEEEEDADGSRADSEQSAARSSSGQSES